MLVFCILVRFVWAVQFFCPFKKFLDSNFKCHFIFHPVAFLGFASCTNMPQVIVSFLIIAGSASAWNITLQGSIHYYLCVLFRSIVTP